LAGRPACPVALKPQILNRAPFGRTRCPFLMRMKPSFPAGALSKKETSAGESAAAGHSTMKGCILVAADAGPIVDASLPCRDALVPRNLPPANRALANLERAATEHTPPIHWSSSRLFMAIQASVLSRCRQVPQLPRFGNLGMRLNAASPMRCYANLTSLSRSG